MDELKRCPFCGGENIYINGYETPVGTRWHVVCLDCMATVDPGWIQQKYRAIEAWNRRASGWVSVEEIAEIIIQAEDCIKVALDTQDRNYLEKVIKQYIPQPPCEIKEYLEDCEDCGFCNPKKGE